MTKRLYISQDSTYKEAVSRDYFSDRKLKVQEFDDIVAVPDSTMKGGIYSIKTHKMLATMDRESQNQAFCIDESLVANAINVDESVIFGGHSYTHFGHLMLEGLSRLWYIAQNPTDTRKIIYIACGEWGEKTATKEKLYEFFTLLNVDKSRVLIIEKPVKFTHISIPEVSYRVWESYTKEYPQLYRHLAQGANALCKGELSFDKIYLSHSKWGHRAEQCFLNEQIYENFFKNCGYEIIYPEEHSVTKIAYLMNNAKEVATTMGSTAHLALFCKEKTRFIVLTRECNSSPALTSQCLINQAMNLDWFIINANLNLLPSFDQNTGWGVVNFAFTDDFRAFVGEHFVGDFKSELSQTTDTLAFLKAWVQFYSKPEYFKRILANYTAFDFVNKLSQVLFGTTLDKTLFVESVPTQLTKRKEKWHKRFLRHLKKMKF